MGSGAKASTRASLQAPKCIQVGDLGTGKGGMITTHLIVLGLQLLLLRLGFHQHPPHLLQRGGVLSSVGRRAGCCEAETHSSCSASEAQLLNYAAEWTGAAPLVRSVETPMWSGEQINAAASDAAPVPHDRPPCC